MWWPTESRSESERVYFTYFCLNFSAFRTSTISTSTVCMALFRVWKFPRPHVCVFVLLQPNLPNLQSSWFIKVKRVKLWKVLKSWPKVDIRITKAAADHQGSTRTSFFRNVVCILPSAYVHRLICLWVYLPVLSCASVATTVDNT